MKHKTEVPNTVLSNTLYEASESIATYYTFSGFISTSKRIRPMQSIRTIANDKNNNRIGFLATNDPYLLK